jgi:hypothetical protein
MYSFPSSIVCKPHKAKLCQSANHFFLVPTGVKRKSKPISVLVSVLVPSPKLRRRHLLGFADRLALHPLQFLMPHVAKKAELLIAQRFPLDRFYNLQECIFLQLNDLLADGFEVSSTFP